MEAKNARQDIIIYAVLSAASFIFYKWIIPTQIYMSKTAKAEAFSPDTFPNAVSIMLLIISLAGLALAIFRYRKAVEVEGKPVKGEDTRTKREKIGEFIPYAVFGLVLLYAILFGWIGFVPASCIVPPIILFVIGCKKWSFYAIYYIFAIAMYMLFRYALLVPIH